MSLPRANTKKLVSLAQFLRLCAVLTIASQVVYCEASPAILTSLEDYFLRGTSTMYSFFGLNHFKNETECSPGGEESFPDDIFTDEQRLQGALILHFIGGLYSFTVLAVICNDYFIPSVECICDDLKISKDVAAATFMAVATSSPELAVNMISTFLIDSNIGIGTIVGSSMFNTLGVGAIGGLAASAAIPIKRWPLFRDSTIYCCTVAVLVSMTWDNVIDWYESSILVALYFVYFAYMFNHKRISRFIKRCFTKSEQNKEINFGRSTSKNSEEEEVEDRYTARVSIILRRSTRSIKSKLDEENNSIGEPAEEVKIRKSLWRFPKEKTFAKKLWFVYTWPIKLLLTCLIPSPKTFRKLYPLSFIMCIVCIGANSYFVTWMITIIGDTLNVPDSIMGMTFLAAGGCLPEAVSIFIMSRRGEGGMGVSNSLGANTLNILFSLGTPWFIKSMVLISEGGDGKITMPLSGIDIIIISLILAAACLNIVMYIGKYEMKRSVGATILVIYFVFIIFAILLESGVFFEIPAC